VEKNLVTVQVGGYYAELVKCCWNTASLYQLFLTFNAHVQRPEPTHKEADDDDRYDQAYYCGALDS
jgi:hypothetical protein